MLEDSLFFPMALSLLAWTAGTALHRRFHTALCSPLLIAVLLTMAVLWGLDVPYESYYRGAQPCTGCSRRPRSVWRSLSGKMRRGSGSTGKPFWRASRPAWLRR